MAEKKNFIIENYNGVDYDTLYPETNSGQVWLDSEGQAATNLESGATLNDAFNSFTKSEASFQVGDTLTTARTNLDNKWTLCNGDFVQLSKYPEVKNLFKQAFFNFYKLGEKSLDASYRSSAMAVNTVNGKDQFLIAINKGADTSEVYVATDLSDTSTWVKKYDNAREYNVKFVGDTWIILRDFKADSSVGWAKYYNGDLTSPTATFSSIYGADTEAHDSIYANGKYYVLVYNNVNIYTDLASPPVVIHNTGLADVISVVPEGVVCGLKNLGGQTSTSHILVIDKDNTATTHDGLTLASGDVLEGSYPYICYFKNKYYMIISSSWGSSIGQKLYVSDSLLSGYAPVKNQSGEQITFSSGRSNMIGRMPTVTDDLLIFPDGFCIDANGVVQYWQKQITYNSEASSITNGSTSVVVGDNNYYYMSCDGSTKIATTYKQMIAPSINVPTVSIADDLYTYIKIKSKSSCTLTVSVTPDDTTIEVKDSDGKVVTPNEGSTNVFTLYDITSQYTITASKDGYVTQTVTIQNTKNQQVDITLVAQ